MVVRARTAAPPAGPAASPAERPAAESRPVAVPGTTGVTLAEFARMRDVGMPTELVRGEIVEVPRPIDLHGVYCQNVNEELAAWSPKRARGWLLPNDTGVVLEEDGEDEEAAGTLRGPDLLFVSHERIAASGEPFPSGDWLRTPPELAVEVKSPSESWPDTRRKAVEYLEAGVGEVWVLDGPTRQLRVHRNASEDPLTLTEADELTSPLLPGFACKVADLLAVGPAAG